MPTLQPARGLAFRLAKGQGLKLTNTFGTQVVDTWAFSAEGTYCLAFTRATTLAGGTRVSDDFTLAMAVGDVEVRDRKLYSCRIRGPEQTVGRVQGAHGGSDRVVGLRQRDRSGEANSCGGTGNESCLHVDLPLVVGESNRGQRS